MPVACIQVGVVIAFQLSSHHHFVRGCPGGGGKRLLSQFALTLQQQFDFGRCQSPQFGRGTELLIQ